MTAPAIVRGAGDAPNALYTFGHGHMGLSWAAAMGRLAAGLAIGRPSSFDLSPFRLWRLGAMGAEA